MYITKETERSSIAALTPFKSSIKRCINKKSIQRCPKLTFSILAGCASVMLFSSCGTIFSGTSQNVTFTGSQKGGRVSVDNQEQALPATIKISKKVDTATFSHPKYGSKDLSWERDFKWGYWWMDLLFTPGYGLTGFITDGVTGGWYEHPHLINYNFVTGATNAPAKKTN